MNPEHTKGLLRSETVLWTIGVGVTWAANWAVKQYGLPLIPPDVHAELVSAVAAALDVLAVGMMGMIVRGRAKARAVIQSWW